MKDAVEGLVAVLRADFGTIWMRHYSDAEALRQWKRRAYQQIRDLGAQYVRPAYDRAVRQHAPHMPQLAHITGAMAELRADASRPEHSRFIALPKPGADRERVAGELRTMRELLSGRANRTD